VFYRHYVGCFFCCFASFFPHGTIYIGAQRYSEAFAYNEPVTYCLLIALLFMAAAVAFNGIALLTSVWVKNIFAVMAAPTLLYMGLTYVMSMGPTKVNLLDPTPTWRLQTFLFRYRYYIWFVIGL